MTYRERRLRRAERLREWAEKREERASAVLTTNSRFTDDYAFNTQPGHIPLRARVIAQNDRAIDSLVKAEGMASKADEIERQADRAIYSDDANATDRLRERIADLEAERDRIKAYNASCRKGSPDVSLLDESQRADVLSLAKIGFLRANGSMPAYATSNLSGNITRNRKRLDQLDTQAEGVR